ncbi:hypothetical protein AQUCO_01900144v1 [Aquilegia coerulea]|uniref:Uncharacterized protein n=1 Tax=Aquilegia coerulea TaxID=218851 RepID=A0A2G5DJ79_AQUCA|nr:hypothetical protein AQUCO_01900144v1 [Aquilegia coerulea]
MWLVRCAPKLTYFGVQFMCFVVKCTHAKMETLTCRFHLATVLSLKLDCTNIDGAIIVDVTSQRFFSLWMLTI